MTDYEYIRKLIKDAFLAGYWVCCGKTPPSHYELQADIIIAISKMQEMVAVLDIDFEDGRIIQECGGE